MNNNKPKIPLKPDESDRITDETFIPEIIPVITIGESIFAIKGDISFVTGLPKAGKSAISIFMLATALGAHPEADTLQIRTTPANGKPVIYIDTEQPKAYTKRNLNQIKDILGVDSMPDNLHIYNLKKYPRPEKKRRVFELMRNFPDAHLWIIDGVADLINDPNDTKESFNILDELATCAENYDTAIVLYLHENPGSGKMRGNLGSEAERKCGATVTVKKDRQKGIHFLEARIIRGSSDFPDIVFRWDKELGRMASVDADEARELTEDKKSQEGRIEMLTELASRCTLAGSIRLKHQQLVNNIMLYHPPTRSGGTVSRNTAIARIKEMVQLELVQKDENGLYYLCNPGQIQN